VFFTEAVMQGLRLRNPSRGSGSKNKSGAGGGQKQREKRTGGSPRATGSYFSPVPKKCSSLKNAIKFI
jgi:hypothetical protein